MAHIEDYAMIGDCRTAALVCRDGSIDWFCCPRFDSEACFAALLGSREHGRWLIAPRGEPRVTRRYRPNTLVLETHFETEEGAATLIDFMPPGGRHSTIVRLLVGTRGKVTDQEIDLRESLRIKKLLEGIMAKNTGQKPERIHEDMERDKWLTADEAKKYGIVDAIISSPKALAK